jgi:hypothetical protein
VRGLDEIQEMLYTFLGVEEFVRGDRPMRAVRVLANECMSRLSGLCCTIHPDTGRAPIGLEKPICVLLQ